MMGGWTFDAHGIRIGLMRVLFPFFAGVLLARTARLRCVPYAFGWCSLLLLLALVYPRVGGPLWRNGLYEAGAISRVFPLVVWLGAGGQLASAGATRLCRFFGEVSYPLYITHYPFLQLYTA